MARGGGGGLAGSGHATSQPARTTQPTANTTRTRSPDTNRGSPDRETRKHVPGHPAGARPHPRTRNPTNDDPPHPNPRPPTTPSDRRRPRQGLVPPRKAELHPSTTPLEALRDVKKNRRRS